MKKVRYWYRIDNWESMGADLIVDAKTYSQLIKNYKSQIDKLEGDELDALEIWENKISWNNQITTIDDLHFTCGLFSVHLYRCECDEGYQFKTAKKKVW